MKEELNRIVSTLICGAIAAAAGTVAFLFAVVAAFLWTQQHYDGIVASIVVGGMFLLVAVIALIWLSVARRRAERRKTREEAEAAAAAPSWLSDPAMLLAAFQVARTIGFGKIIPLTLAGVAAFGAAGLMSNRAEGKKRRERTAETPEDRARRAA